MTAVLFLYALAVGAPCCAAASAAERLLRLWRLPVRGVWATAMVLTIGLPLVARFGPADVTPTTVVTSPVAAPVQAVARTPATVETSLAQRARMGARAVATALGSSLDRMAAASAPLDRILAGAWALSSLLLALLLLRSALRAHRRSRSWQSRTVDGVAVLVAPDAGPAVMGGGKTRVVIPEWMLDLDESLRRMVLRHELEHIRAGDPQLLLVAIAATIAMPWNPALWWQLRRLRTAVELDCDRRVLRVHRDVERYGLLLLAVGQRAGAPLRLGAPALAESTGSLERRIAVMTTSPPSRRERVMRALLLAPLAAALGAAACMMPSPNAVAGPEAVPPVEQRTRATVDSAQTYFEFQVEKPVSQLPGGAPRYPAELRARGVSGTVIAQFVVDTAGVPETSSYMVLESSHPLFDDAIREALPGMRFVPAEVAGRRVRQLVQQPFIFRVDAATTPDAAVPVRAPAGQLVPLTRDRDHAMTPTVAPPDSADHVPLRAGELRPAMRTPAPAGARQRAYFEFEVERPAEQIPGGAPEYPPEMRAQRAGGEVLAQFVVDADGRVDPATFQVIRSTHEQFTTAVRRALPRMRFAPAQLAGRSVAQVVQMPYVFDIR